MKKYHHPYLNIKKKETIAGAPLPHRSRNDLGAVNQFSARALAKTEPKSNLLLWDRGPLEKLFFRTLRYPALD